MKKRFIKRNDMKTFSDRLLYLYAEKDLLKNGSVDFNTVATRLYDMGLREYTAYNDDPDTEKSRNSQFRNTIDTLRKHTKDTSETPNISGMWLNIYCQFFKCSCDFLMGYIDRPTLKKTDIHAETGLTDKAIETLSDFKKHGGISYRDDIETLNFLLSHKFDFSMLLSGIQDLLDSKYAIPVYHENKKRGSASNKVIVPDNPVDVMDCNYNVNGKTANELRFIHLAKSKDDPLDNIPVAITPDFLEHIAIMKIEENLHKLKNVYEQKDRG